MLIYSSEFTTWEWYSATRGAIASSILQLHTIAATILYDFI